MRHEIGSYFELDYNSRKNSKNKTNWLSSLFDSAFTFSGRSAIELAILDIKMDREVKNVYMPSYCCKSMVDPFIKNDIQVFFYDVYFEENTGLQYNINPDVKCDVFFAMSYFGIEEFQQDPMLKFFQRKGTVIIEDITHRLLSEESYSSYADYTIASLRKWFPIATGGIINKKTNKLNIIPDIESDNLVVEKIKAMKNKKDYLKGANLDKTTFLNELGKFEKEFSKRGYRYRIDNTSLSILNQIDISFIKQKRRNNAQYLYNEIKKNKQIKFLVPNLDFVKMTPLFLPILLEKNKRNNLREFLIQHKVYCPVHWPKTKVTSSFISNHELSLICDQRYTEKDMMYITKLIRQWHNNSF